MKFLATLFVGRGEGQLQLRVLGQQAAELTTGIATGP
jgi:hypothetical protein